MKKVIAFLVVFFCMYLLYAEPPFGNPNIGPIKNPTKDFSNPELSMVETFSTLSPIFWLIMIAFVVIIIAVLRILTPNRV